MCKMAVAIAGCMVAAWVTPASASNAIMQQQRQLQMQQQLRQQQVQRQQQQEMRRIRQEQGRQRLTEQNQRVQMLILEGGKQHPVEEDVLDYDEKPSFHYSY